MTQKQPDIVIIKVCELFSLSLEISKLLSIVVQSVGIEMSADDMSMIVHDMGIVVYQTHPDLYNQYLRDGKWHMRKQHERT